MALRVVDKAPVEGDFTPLSEHQAETPSTFFGGKPVLYAKHSGLTLSLPRSKIQSDPAFAKFAVAPVSTDGPAEETESALVRDVDVWVNSEDLILFQNQPTPTGVAIPYPSIALHATMKWQSRVDALYMNISLNDVEQVNDEDDIEILEATLLPPNFEAASEGTPNPIQEIFSAMNECADLHPDPNGSDDDDEEEDRYEIDAPGAGGWITAENMHEFTDEDGNFTGMGRLGSGAGTVRSRELEGKDDTNGLNGDGDEAKWRRTD